MFRKCLDLTHALSPHVPTWNGSCGFSHEIKKDYDRTFRVQQIKMHAGVGTHMDAPSHRFHGAASIDQIPLDVCIAPACVIDVSHEADADYLLSPDAIFDNEKKHGEIASGSLCIIYTGWERYWNEPHRYRDVHFPAVSGDAADLLLKKGIVGLAIDTLSPDRPDSEYPVHEKILGAGKYIIENIAQAGKLPARGCWVFALPLKGKDLTEAPARVIAVWEKV